MLVSASDAGGRRVAISDVVDWFEAKVSGGSGSALVSVGFDGELCSPQDFTRVYFR